MTNVHIGSVVKDLIAFYDPILKVKLEFASVYKQVEAFGAFAFERFQQEDYRSIPEFNNYNPEYIGKSNEENILSNPSKDDFLETAANCFGFTSFEQAASQGNVAIDMTFETAVDHLLAGDIDALAAQIKSDPGLLKQNSNYGHKAGLIHYVGSNGVEFWRQVVPENLVEILSLLLEKGADPDMWNNIYGSPSTLRGLIETSAHPYQAGLTPRLLKLL